MPDKSNFKEGLKGTTLFGGVGILNILISIAKSKIIAVLLGPAGMGVLGLFNSAIDLINKSTNFSLRTSAVKDISIAYASNDEYKLSKNYSEFKKLVILTGLLGLVVCVALSPYLSFTSFGDYSHTVSFILLAVSLPILQLSDGLNVLMQGTRNLRLLAKANIYGNILSLLSVLPLYYLFGIAGIAYTILLGFSIQYLFVWVFSRKIQVVRVPVSMKQALKGGRSMLSMGFMISLQGILVALSAYTIRAYISHVNSVEEVGLYTAGFYIINTYTGIFFSGMSTEYYPRIASMANNNKKVFEAVDSQSVLSIMILAPLLCSFLLLGNIGIMILYSGEFLKITMMINISMLGMFFKAPSWCLGYVFLGKGDSLAYFWNEFFAIIYTLAFNIIFYDLWGLTGMGLSFLLSFLIYWIQNIIVCCYRYGYCFNYSFLKTFLPQLFIAGLCFICSMIGNILIKYIIGCVLIGISLSLSYRVLKDNVDMNAVRSKFKFV